MSKDGKETKKRKVKITEMSPDDPSCRRGRVIGHIGEHSGKQEPSFKEGLKRYIIVTGKQYGNKNVTDEDCKELMDLFMNYGMAEEARVQWGAEPTFTDSEYDDLFNQGQAMQDK